MCGARIDTKRTREVAHARGLINADETLSVVKNAKAVDVDGTKYPRPPGAPEQFRSCSECFPASA